MFTLTQIQAAHSKVKSGADFPQYMQDIIALGVTSFETFVFDNNTNYKGINRFSISSQGRPEILQVASESNAVQFKTDIKAHQQGQTDYLTFLEDCAKSGIEKWIVETDTMTCTYFDKAGNALLIEKIPSV